MDLLKDQGVSFHEDAEAAYSEASSTLTLTNTPSQLALAEGLFWTLAVEESKARAGF